MQFLFVKMQALVFMSLFVVAVNAFDESNKKCTDLIEQKFRFGMSFRPDIEKVLNLGFIKNCDKLVDYLSEELNAWVESSEFDSSEIIRRGVLDHLMPLLHQRAGMSTQTRGNLTRDQQAVEDVLRAKPFGGQGSLFEEPEDFKSPCSERTQHALKVSFEFEPLLAAHLDNFEGSACSAFLEKLVSMFDDIVGFKKWSKISKNSKRGLIGNVFTLLHLQALKPESPDAGGKKLSLEPDSGEETVEEPIWKTVAKDSVFLGNIFKQQKEGDVVLSTPTVEMSSNSTSESAQGNETASVSSVQESSGLEAFYRILFWTSLLLMLPFTVYMGLRYFGIIRNLD